MDRSADAPAVGAAFSGDVLEALPPDMWLLILSFLRLGELRFAVPAATAAAQDGSGGGGAAKSFTFDPKATEFSFTPKAVTAPMPHVVQMPQINVPVGFPQQASHQPLQGMAMQVQPGQIFTAADLASPNGIFCQAAMIRVQTRTR